MVELKKYIFEVYFHLKKVILPWRVPLIWVTKLVNSKCKHIWSFEKKIIDLSHVFWKFYRPTRLNGNKIIFLTILMNKNSFG